LAKYNPQELLKIIQKLKKEQSKNLATELKLSQQKYENLKNFLKEILVSLSKDNQEELINGLSAEIKTREKNIPLFNSTEIRTTELTSKLELTIEEIKELKEKLKAKLTESETKIQRLEKELSEAKSRAEERQKKVEELDELTIKTPIYEKVINFLKAKSAFLNARRETIEELQKCYNK